MSLYNFGAKENSITKLYYVTCRYNWECKTGYNFFSWGTASL